MMYRICFAYALLAGTALGWVSPPSSLSPLAAKTTTEATSTKTSTAIHMFDWLNPNKSKETKEEKKDIFADFFNQGGGSKEKLKEEIEASAGHVAEEVEPIAAIEEPATVTHEVVSPPETVTPAPEVVPVAADVVSTAEPTSTESRQTGTVKWFSGKKGYGFIAPENGGEDVFVHNTQIQTDGYRVLYQRETVEFDLEIVPEGRPRALHVTGPNGAAVRRVGIEKARDEQL